MAFLNNIRPIDPNEFFRRPEPQPVEPPPRPAYAPGFPLKIDCEVDTRFVGPVAKSIVHDDLTWTVVWKTYKCGDEMHSISLTMTLLCPSNKAYFVKFTTRPDNVLLGSLVQQMDAVVFDKTHKSVNIRDAFTYADARNFDSVNPAHIFIKISIESVVEIEKFDFHNQMWPLGNTWVNYGTKCAVRMKERDLVDANPKYERFRRDLNNQVMSSKEKDAFFNFAGAYFNRWFYGTEEFHEAIRNGVKFGFTRNYERFDTADSDLDFMARVALPLYQHFGNETNPPEDQVKHINQRSVMAKTQFRLVGSNPFRRWWILFPQDVRTKDCQFYLYLMETATGETLLMGGGIFDCNSKKDVDPQFCALVHVQIIIDDMVKIQHRATRIIHPKQRTITFVIDVMNPEYLSILESDRAVCMVRVTKTDTNLYHVPNYAYETFDEKERKQIAKDEKAARRAERQRKREEQGIDEPDSEDEEEKPRDLLMPGLVDAYLICREGKRIGVNRIYISHHAEYFRSKFYNTAFGDCGGFTAHVDERVEIVWDVLQIIYHRSLMLGPDNYIDVVMLGDRWLCKAVTQYVEMALLNTDVISAVDKRDVANALHFDVINYILRHPEYAEDFNIVLPRGERRVIAELMGDEIDGGDGKRQPRKRAADEMAQASPESSEIQAAGPSVRRAMPVVAQQRRVVPIAPLAGPRRRMPNFAFMGDNINRIRGQEGIEIEIADRELLARVGVRAPLPRENVDEEDIIVID